MADQKSAVSPRRDEDFPEWYQQVVKAADLAENSDVRGCMVIKPWGYGIWEIIQRMLDGMFKAHRPQERLFPALHSAELSGEGGGARRRLCQGMRGCHPSPAGGRRRGRPAPAPAAELDRAARRAPDLARPSSARATRSGCSRIATCRSSSTNGRMSSAGKCGPRLFLRTAEFLWQEGHTAHETEAEASRGDRTDAAASTRPSRAITSRSRSFTGEKSRASGFPAR